MCLLSGVVTCSMDQVVGFDIFANCTDHLVRAVAEAYGCLTAQLVLDSMWQGGDMWRCHIGGPGLSPHSLSTFARTLAASSLKPLSLPCPRVSHHRVTPGWFCLITSRALGSESTARTTLAPGCCWAPWVNPPAPANRSTTSGPAIVLYIMVAKMSAVGNWDPPARGESMPADVLQGVLRSLYKAYEFHVPRKSRKPRETVICHARLLLEHVHLDRHMERLCWALSDALMCGDYPENPPAYQKWEDDYVVNEALVTMLLERMARAGTGPVCYSRRDSEALFSYEWGRR